MADTPEPEKIDYEAKAEKRHEDFLARTIAVISGAAAGIATGRHMVHESLRNWVHERLMSRDWTNGRLRQVLGDIKDGKADTYSGAPTSPENLEKWAQDVLNVDRTKLAGTAVGDKFTFNAFKDLQQSRPDFINGLVTKFEEEEKLLAQNRDKRIDKIKSNTKLSADLMATEICKEESNFRTFTNMAKRKIFDIPVFDELMKPERMGLKFRHAHNKGAILAISTLTAVGLGTVIYKGAQSYFRRNDKPEAEEKTFQATLESQRDSKAITAGNSRTA